MCEIIILGFGIYNTKAGATKYSVAFSTSFRDNFSHLATGSEASTCDVDPDTYQLVSKHKIGDKVKGYVTRKNWKLEIVGLLPD